MIGITGASGQLGQTLMGRWPESLPIGRLMPTKRLDVLIHAACPKWHDNQAVDDFRRFNDQVLAYVLAWEPLVINLGSWWQLADGSCQDLPYVKLKHEQEQMLPTARHLYPYHIYGEVKGLIHDILEGVEITTVLDEPLDFIHVSDVARGVDACLDKPAGRYAVYTKVLTYPDQLVPSAVVKPREFTALTTYPLPSIIEPWVNLKDYLARHRDASFSL